MDYRKLKVDLDQAIVDLFGHQASKRDWWNTSITTYSDSITIVTKVKNHSGKYIPLTYEHPKDADLDDDDVDQKHLFDSCIKSWLIDYGNEILYPNGGYLGSEK